MWWNLCAAAALALSAAAAPIPTSSTKEARCAATRAAQLAVDRALARAEAGVAARQLFGATDSEADHVDEVSSSRLVA
jgi:hypothetical protein